jgi:hypothetical protein
MIKVNIDEVLRTAETWRYYNNLHVEEVTFINDKGEDVTFTPEQIKDWKFVGMGLIGFIENHYGGIEITTETINP